jgi:putative phage-type endonuclease
MSTPKPTQTFSPGERQVYIGASEFGAVLGIDAYKTPLDVYNEKVGLSTGFGGNRHTERGIRLEKVAADLYTELTGKKLRRQNYAYVHPEYPFIVGHLDRLLVGSRAVAEIKCPSLGMYRRMQREGLPDSMIAQMQGYLGLSRHETGEWLVFCADQMDLITFSVQFDSVIYDAAIKACVNLWQNHIIPQIPPTAEAADKPALEFQKIGGDVTFRDDPEWAEAAGLFREAKQLESDAKELIELAKGRIKNAVENEYGKYQGAGARIYFSQKPGRKTLDKEAFARAHPTIDLAAFEKAGKPYDEIRAYFNIGE